MVVSRLRVSSAIKLVHSGGKEIANLNFESTIHFKGDLGLLQELHSTGWWSSCLVAKPLPLRSWTHLYYSTVTKTFLPCHFVMSKKAEIGWKGEERWLYNGDIILLTIRNKIKI